MKFGSINFPQALLDALRDKRLVVFAGAGVSMGPPAKLPSFPDLAKRIAQGRIARELNPHILDRELGDLEREGVQVHRLCREIIQGGPPLANELHKSLLQLFGDVDAVRVVTTNYDPHFTGAAVELWQRTPAIYGAPALPLGSDFKGIVHVHGTEHEDSCMVLTDSDFGRAYLTQGWARRFLLDVFTNYTVLFVGYTHSETVMQYMARALPPELIKARFALIHADDGTESWKSLGITPIQFPSRGEDKYIELSHGVAVLASAEHRGVLALQADIGKIAVATPPHDAATVDQVRDAVSKAHTLRFFAQNAKPAHWLEWLDDRGLLDPLFKQGPLDELGYELCAWATQDVLEDSTALMTVVGKHGLQLSRTVWLEIASQLTRAPKDKPAPPKFGRWLTLLLAMPPANFDNFTVVALAAAAGRLDDLAGALAIFELMTRPEVQVTSERWPEVDGTLGPSRADLRLTIKASPHYILKLWTSVIAPRLEEVHSSALMVCVGALEARVALRRRWDGRDAWDWDSGRQASIEPDEDRFASELKPLVDGARDCLEWIAAHRDVVDLHDFVGRLWAYESKLVKRLAIHAIRVGRDSDDAKLAWLFSVGAQDPQLQHEVLELLKQCYPNASPVARSATMNWISLFDTPTHVEEAQREDARDSWKLHVLWWLRASTPDCLLVHEALEALEPRHRDWTAAKQPEIRIRQINQPPGLRPSPVTVDQLLKKPAAEWIELFMTFEQERPFGPDREGLWLAAREAAKQNEVWHLELLAALQTRWDSPMWSTLIGAWATWPEDASAAAERLNWLQQPELLKHHARAASHVLRSLVAGPVKPYVADLIPQADEICLRACAMLELEPAEYDGNGWLDAAINRPAGALADYVGDSLALRPGTGIEPPMGLSTSVEQLFARLLLMKNGHVSFVRPVMARRLVYLAEIAPEWTKETIIPWLSSPDDTCFAQSWDGFLLGGRLVEAVGDMAKQAFLDGTQRVAKLLPGRLDEYLEAYVTYMLLAADPLVDWIPHLVQHSGDDTRKMFAGRMHWLLSKAPAQRVATWWNGWLKTYWERRIKGMPKPLAGGELAEMLGWPAVLPQFFAESVKLTVEMPKGQLEYTSLFEDLMERDLYRLQPEATAVYLTTTLGWSGAQNLRHEVPDLVKGMDRSKISPTTLEALDEALALLGLLDLQWAPATTEIEE